MARRSKLDMMNEKIKNRKELIDSIDFKGTFDKQLKKISDKSPIVEKGPLKGFHILEIDDFKNFYSKFIISARENKVFIHDNTGETVTDSIKLKPSDNTVIEFIELIPGMMLYITHNSEDYKFVVFHNEEENVTVTLEYLSNFIPDKIRKYLVNKHIINDTKKE